MDNIGQQDPNVGDGAGAPTQDLGAFMASMTRYMDAQNAIQQQILSTHRRVSWIEDHIGAQIAGE